MSTMLEYFLVAYGNIILEAILVVIFGMAGYLLKKAANRYLNTQEKQAIAKNVVLFVEQVWVGIHGPEKLSKALSKAEVLLESKGIPFDAVEMEVLIEAAVAEFNEVFAKTDAATEDVTVTGFGLSDAAYDQAVEAGVM